MDGAFAHHWPGYTGARPPEDQVRAWSVGTVLGNQTLVQARPIVRDAQSAFLSDFLRTAAPCTVSLFAAAGGNDASACPRVEVTRFQRWVGACDAPPSVQGSEEFDEILRSIRSEFPPFLTRAQTKKTVPMTLFFGFIAALHGAGGLRATYVEPERIRDALRALEERLGSHPTDLFVYDGRTLGVMQRQAPLFAVEPAPEGMAEGLPAPSDSAVAEGRRPMLLLSTPDGVPSTPFPGAERIPGGVFTTNAANPWKLERA